MKNQKLIRRQILRRLEPRAKALYLQMPQYAKAATPEKRKGIARRTPARAKEERQYNARVKVWLKGQPCWVMWKVYRRDVPATQCHHYQGRRNALLLYEPFWIPVSAEGHAWIENNQNRARELGLLCPKGHYNNPPPQS